MSSVNFQYIPGDSLFHQLDGRTKMALIACWAGSIFLFYDLRILGVFLFGGFTLLAMSGIPFYRVKRMLAIMCGFLVLTAVLTNVLTPSYAGKYIEVQHALISWGSFTITKETAFYSLMLVVKYMAIFPVAVLFILTTHPSKLASSLHRIGLPYKIAYSFQIALRYLPDVQREFLSITYAQQARGLHLGKKEKLGTRVKGLLAILIPLLFSSLDRVEVVSNAMDLRGFGRRPSRTWYNATSFNHRDYLVLSASIVMLALSVVGRVYLFKSFWYPF